MLHSSTKKTAKFPGVPETNGCDTPEMILLYDEGFGGARVDSIVFTRGLLCASQVCYSVYGHPAAALR